MKLRKAWFDLNDMHNITIMGDDNKEHYRTEYSDDEWNELLTKDVITSYPSKTFKNCTCFEIK